jgi:hypothetical protein
MRTLGADVRIGEELMMKGPGRILTIAVVAAALASACGPGWEIDLGSQRTVTGSGQVVEESRSVGGVTGVELAMPGTLQIELGGSESLRIEAEDNLLEHIETDVVGGTLTVTTSSGVTLLNTEPIRYYLTVASLDSIVASSSGDIVGPGFETDRFSVAVHSSGNVSLGPVVCESLVVEVSSSGSVDVESLEAGSIDVQINSSGNVLIGRGAVDTQEVQISSSGEYRAETLASLEARVRLTSSGGATLRVQDRLTADLSSSGSVFYYGDPSVDEDTTSSGRVVRAGE